MNTCRFRYTRLLILKRKEYNKETHMAFTEFAEASDNDIIEKLWSIMSRFPDHLLLTIKRVYKNNSTILTGYQRKYEKNL